MRLNKRNKAAIREALTAYLLLSPAVLLFLVIGLFTVLFSVWLSFQHMSQGGSIGGARFAGLDNFRDFLFGRDTILSNNFRRAVLNNLTIAVAKVALVIPISLLLAMLLQRITRGVSFFRAIYMLPMITSSVAVYYVWTGIYERTGSLNQILKLIGLEQWVTANGWLGEMNTALPAIIVMMVWGAVPGTMILYFAGLQTIDNDLYEAAEIDGANAWKKLLHITWPALKPISVICIILTLNGAIQTFDQIYVMTGGGPVGATQVVNLLIYEEAFGSGSMGRANAMGWTMFILTFFLSLVSMRALKDNSEK